MAGEPPPVNGAASTFREPRVINRQFIVQDKVGEQLQIHDPHQLLRAGDFQEVLDECVDKVSKVNKARNARLQLCH